MGPGESERDVQKGLRSSRSASLYSSEFGTAPEFGAECIGYVVSNGLARTRWRVQETQFLWDVVDPCHGLPGRGTTPPTRCDVSNRLAWTVRSDTLALLVLLIVQACLNGRVCQISVLTLSVEQGLPWAVGSALRIVRACSCETGCFG